MDLSTRLGHASACGVRFLFAELIFAYVTVGAYRHGNAAEVLLSTLELSEQSSAILQASSKYG
jgi:hypothetical protein